MCLTTVSDCPSLEYLQSHDDAAWLKASSKIALKAAESDSTRVQFQRGEDKGRLRGRVHIPMDPCRQ